RRVTTSHRHNEKAVGNGRFFTLAGALVAAILPKNRSGGRVSMSRRDFDPGTAKPDGRGTAKGTVFDAGAGGPWRGFLAGEVIGGEVTVLADGNDTPGTGPRLHVHPYDETFVVVEGMARFFVGDEV